jgi:hypothetical protein
MTARRLLAGVCLGMLVVTGATRTAGAQDQTAAPRATLTAHAGNVVGSVTDRSESPVAGATLRLRDLTTGRLVATTRTDQTGQFRLTGMPSGSYVVELVDENGIVRAVGQTFTLSPGLTMTTHVRIGAQAPWYRGFFSNAALAAVSSAASIGVTAVGNGFQPASGRF